MEIPKKFNLDIFAGGFLAAKHTEGAEGECPHFVFAGDDDHFGQETHIFDQASRVFLTVSQAPD